MTKVTANPFIGSMSPRIRIVYLLLMIPNLVIAVSIPFLLGAKFPANVLLAIGIILVLRNIETLIFKYTITRSK